VKANITTRQIMEIPSSEVFVAYIESGNQGHFDMVGGVFSTERKALDYIIKLYYSTPFYSRMSPTWLDDNARPHVVKMIVQ
jgi:hypothetical protein